MRKKRGKGKGRWIEGAVKNEEKVLSEEGRALRGGAPEEIRVKRKEADKPPQLRRGESEERRTRRDTSSPPKKAKRSPSPPPKKSIRDRLGPASTNGSGTNGSSPRPESRGV